MAARSKDGPRGGLCRRSPTANGKGTGQIWVTSSRPISKGGSSRRASDAWPICAAVQWISAAIAANSGATGASSETA